MARSQSKAEIPMIDKGAGVAVWRQIKDFIAGQVRGGIYGLGDRLPTEHEFAARFGVNRHTVRRAIGALVEEGLLRVDQGRGTFVLEPVILYPVSKRTRFSANIAAQKKAPGGTLLKAWTEAAEGAVSTALNLRKGTKVIVLETLGEADGRPVSLVRHYFPAARFAGIDRHYRESRSVSRSLHAMGVADYLRKSTRVTARMPQPDEALLLKQPGNRPVLVTEGVNHDLEGLPIEYTAALFAGDRVQVVVES